MVRFFRRGRQPRELLRPELCELKKPGLDTEISSDHVQSSTHGQRKPRNPQPPRSFFLLGKDLSGTPSGSQKPKELQTAILLPFKERSCLKTGEMEGRQTDSRGQATSHVVSFISFYCFICSCPFFLAHVVFVFVLFYVMSSFPASRAGCLPKTREKRGVHCARLLDSATLRCFWSGRFRKLGSSEVCTSEVREPRGGGGRGPTGCWKRRRETSRGCEILLGTVQKPGCLIRSPVFFTSKQRVSTMVSKCRRSSSIHSSKTRLPNAGSEGNSVVLEGKDHIGNIGLPPDRQCTVCYILNENMANAPTKRGTSLTSKRPLLGFLRIKNKGKQDPQISKL